MEHSSDGEPPEQLKEPSNGDGLSHDNGDDEKDEDYHEITSHSSYEQVMLDVNRCAGRIAHIRQRHWHRGDHGEPSEDITEPFEKLARLIVRLLIKKPELHYYQGFHDVCLTYMTLHGDAGALAKLDRLIDTHFSTFMQPTMNETQEFLALIPIIIGLKDKKLQNYLEKAEVGTIFALSWVITWFSHVIPNECDVETIFSQLESTNDPHLVLYLCAEIVLHKREKLLELEPEMSTVHHFLCQVPRKEKLPIGELLSEAKASFNKWPPELVKERLSQHRARLQVQNYNLIKNFAKHFIPTVTSYVSSPNSRRAIMVLVVASALALQFDRWIR